VKGSIHYATGEVERVQKLILFLFFYCSGGGGWKFFFFFTRIIKRWKEEGGKGYI
jgi:Trk-type K+ transport system membrane component